MQSNAGDQHCGDRDECKGLPPGLNLATNGGPFIFTEQLFYSLEGDRVDVPSVAGNVGHMTDVAVVRCMKSVIHVGAKSERDITSTLILCCIVTVPEQFCHRIREAFCLKNLLPLHDPAFADNRIAGTNEDVRVGVN